MTNNWIKLSTTIFDKTEVVALEIKRDDYGGERKTHLTIFFRGGSHLDITGDEAEFVWGQFASENTPSLTTDKSAGAVSSGD